MMYYTYVLKSIKDSKWYTGATRNLRERLIEHNQQKVHSTKGRGPFKLIYYEACESSHDAFAREKYLKSGLGKRYLKSRLKRSLSQTGFIALVSVILITFVLITFTVSIGLSGFLGRANQLDSEFKEQSIASAEACVEKATADLVAGNPTTGAVTFGGGAYTCTVVSITADTPNAGETTIKSQGIYPITPPLTRSSYTNLVVVVDSTTQAVLSWREYATMP
ncbi:MAG: hypothetical protein A2762_00570 [Candidatus Lloydbacteria bacterium RIFCSPHIGHO2_01_FULL_54_11]|nr:MAG: hypothetical protein A2762_00570 [Candidatus Lloydbacteria bacterium RIFCSPHIGHO2_01_FULL_54_11]